jgi:hypothetical protein
MVVGGTGLYHAPRLIDDESGVGTQVTVGDVNGNGLPDIVVGNKKGTFVPLHEKRSVSREEWEKAQPRRPAHSARSAIIGSTSVARRAGT